MQMLLAALSLVVSGALASSPSAPQGAVSSLSLFEAKEQYDKALDTAYDGFLAAIAKRTADIEASLKSGKDAGGKSARDLEFDLRLLAGERNGLVDDGRLPTKFPEAAALAAALKEAKTKVLDAYKAARFNARKVGDEARAGRVNKGLDFFESLNLHGPRLAADAVAGLVRTGTTNADWHATAGAFEPPQETGPDKAWAPFELGGALLRSFVAKLTLRRGAGEGDLVVGFADADGFDGSVTIAKALIDGTAGKSTAERECHVRVVIAGGRASVELAGDEIEILGSKEAGMGLNLSRLTRLWIARSDKQGPVRVKSLAIRALPTGAEDAAGEAGAEDASDAGSACAGALGATREWSEQLSLVREAHAKYETTVDHIAAECLREFKKVQQPYRDGLMGPSEDTLRRANERIENELLRYLYAAEIPKLLGQEAPLFLQAQTQEYFLARKELYRSYQRTEEVIALRARPDEVRTLRDDLDALKSYQDHAPWLEAEDVKAMVQFKAGPLWEWAFVGNRWIGWRYGTPEGTLVPLLVQGDLPLEFIAEWNIEMPMLQDADELRIRIARAGDEREGSVLGSQVRAIVERKDGDKLAPFTLRAIVQTERLSITVNGVRTWCMASSDASAGGTVKVATDLVLERTGSASEASIWGQPRLKPITSGAKRGGSSGAQRPPEREGPRALQPPRDASNGVRSETRETAPKAPAPRPAPTAAPRSSDRKMEWAEVLEREPDPVVLTDGSRRGEAALVRLPWRVRDRASGIELLLVTPGSFQRGAADDDADAQPNERPPHRVTISQPFYLGRYEVQKSEWAHVMNGESSKPAERGAPATGGFDAVASFLRRCPGLRLPTEAEWEFACRAGSGAPRYAELNECAWSKSSAGGAPHAVGELKANALGFSDMLGNVWEWCSDVYDADAYTRCARGIVDPTGAETGALRVMRGGSFDPNTADATCRASCRGAGGTGDVKAEARGFRVARTP